MVLSKVHDTLEFVSGVTAPKLMNHNIKHTPNDILDDLGHYMKLKVLTDKHGVLKNVHWR